MKKILTIVFAAALSVSIGLLAAQSSPVKATVVPDLEQRLARWKPVEMPFRAEALSARERQLVEQLVEACRELENIYWRQGDPEGLALYISRSPSTDPATGALARYLWINGGRYDLLDENRPFVGRRHDTPGARPLSGRPDARRHRGVRRGASGAEGGDLRRTHRRRPRRRAIEDHSVPRAVQAVARPRGDSPAGGGGPLGRTGVREVPAAAREGPPDGRLLRERPRMGRPRQTRSSTSSSRPTRRTWTTCSA